MHRILPVISLIASVFVAVLPCRAQSSRGEIQAGPAIAYEDAFPAQEIFDRPLLVAFHPTDADMAYVVTQPGQVLRVPRDGSKSDRAVFLDITDRVYMGHFEEGLLGFQFDPDYAANDFVYIYWSEKIKKRAGAMAGGKKRKSNRQSVISRFKVERDGDGVTVDLDSELRLMEVFQPFGNHNGGQLVFGPDGYLYVSVGDGGGDNRTSAQDNADLLGSILRIDVSVPSSGRPYSIPKDNPFAGVSGVRGEIWAYGFRNPWRISFDAADRLWATDVGERKLEEIEIVKKKGNYGWPIMEGTSCFDSCKTTGLELPIWEYTHALGCSITGGYVVQSKPASLIGMYVFADFCSGNVWTLTFNEVTEPSATLLFKSNLQITSFGRALDSSIYLVTRANGLYQLVEG